MPWRAATACGRTWRGVWARMSAWSGPLAWDVATAPAVAVGQHALARATVAAVEQAVSQGDTAPESCSCIAFQAYRSQGGYETLRACRDGRHTPDGVLSRIEESGLRGLGGAGFRSAQKWKFVRQAPPPRLLAINGDEGEPGTFKDRYYLETDPHRFLEGMLIAAWAVAAEAIYIYLRDEYAHIRALLHRELPLLEKAGLIAPGQVQLRRGAGAYICGEETAMLESLEGKRGYPRSQAALSDRRSACSAGRR